MTAIFKDSSSVSMLPSKISISCACWRFADYFFQKSILCSRKTFKMQYFFHIFRKEAAKNATTQSFPNISPPRWCRAYDSLVQRRRTTGSVLSFKGYVFRLCNATLWRLKIGISPSNPISESRSPGTGRVLKAALCGKLIFFFMWPTSKHVPRSVPLRVPLRDADYSTAKSHWCSFGKLL